MRVLTNVAIRLNCKWLVLCFLQVQDSDRQFTDCNLLLSTDVVPQLLFASIISVWMHFSWDSSTNSQLTITQRTSKYASEKSRRGRVCEPRVCNLWRVWAVRKFIVEQTVAGQTISTSLCNKLFRCWGALIITKSRFVAAPVVVWGEITESSLRPDSWKQVF